MAREVPLVRAAGLRPFLYCLERAGVPLDRAFRRAHLEGYPWERPEAPAPLANMFEFLDFVARREGIGDLGLRAVCPQTLPQFGEFGQFIATSSTPREALSKASRWMPYFCSSERLVLRIGAQSDVVLVSFRGRFNAGGVHVAQQLTAALLSDLVDAAGRGTRQLVRAEMTPLEGAGLDCLRARLGDVVHFSESGVLALHFRRGALDQPFPTRLPGDLGRDALPTRWQCLEARPTVIEAIRVQIEEMLSHGTPSVGGVAAAAGVSSRTLQRILAKHDESFRTLLDDVRRVRALTEISDGSARIGVISADLGYSGQGSLTRSVRRWRAQTPREIRVGAAGGRP